MSLPHSRLAEAADQLTEQLARLGTPQRAAWDRDYLHSDLVHLGVPIPDLRRAVNATSRNQRSLTRSDVLALADLLWTSNVYEDRQAAVHLLKAIGWVLRETTRRDHHFVTTWVESRIDRTFGVTLREAVRRLHDTDRTRLINAYRRTHRH
ncbi:DNA alkylation repair protein [Streptomyces sp. NPDC014636]|uniref:DNA alkylation repair protein n=1 Tax=Streptomyces sp. NPDC014636 TaxID=3364876 RepID=UPI0037005B19